MKINFQAKKFLLVFNDSVLDGGTSVSNIYGIWDDFRIKKNIDEIIVAIFVVNIGYFIGIGVKC